MSAAIPTPSNCCVPCETPDVQNVPGPAGAAGTNGTNGTNGVDSYTSTTNTFTVPAQLATVNIPVAVSSWAAVGQIIFIPVAGYYAVTAVPDATHITARNLRNDATGVYASNAAAAVVIASSSKVSPGGLQGQQGTSPASLNALSPTTTKGDLIVDDGTGAGSAHDVRFPATGVQLKVLHADTTKTLGLEYRSIDLTGVTSSLSGALPIASGGTGAITAPLALAALGAFQSFAGLVKNLVIATIPAATYVSRTQVGCSADFVVLKSATTGVFVSPAIAVTLDIAGTVGQPLGLDTGTFNANTWYYVWVVSTGSATTAIFSASYTAPTLGGALATYTYKACVGAVRSDGSSNFIRSIQYGHIVNVEEQVVFTNQTGSTSWGTTTTAAIVPPFTRSIGGTMGVSTETTAPWGIALASDNDGLVGRICVNSADVNANAFNTFFHAAPFSNLCVSSSPQALAWKTVNAAVNQYRVTLSNYTIDYPG